MAWLRIVIPGWSCSIIWHIRNMLPCLVNKACLVNSDFFTRKKVRYILNLAEKEECLKDIDYIIEAGTRLEKVRLAFMAAIRSTHSLLLHSLSAVAPTHRCCTLHCCYVTLTYCYCTTLTLILSKCVHALHIQYVHRLQRIQGNKAACSMTFPKMLIKVSAHVYIHCTYMCTYTKPHGSAAQV